jgi:hypothetical protein
MTIPALSTIVRDDILSFETGGPFQYKPWPEFPGGESGLTIGVGYDLGYQTQAGFTADWGALLLAEDLAVLSRFVGLKAPTYAREIAAAADGFRRGEFQIMIGWDKALKVFDTVTLPRWAEVTAKAYPGSTDLPSHCFWALVGCVFNRGASFGSPGQVSWRTRKDLRDLRDIIAGDPIGWPKAVRCFAAQADTMANTWGRPTVSNISGRRLVEAARFARGLRETTVEPDPSLLLGDTGRRVGELQLALCNHGVRLTVDGQFGRGTMIALWVWHAAQGLPATGIADAGTRARLGL